MNVKKILNGNWIYKNKPASRFFFHITISASVIVTVCAFAIEYIGGMFFNYISALYTFNLDLLGN